MSSVKLIEYADASAGARKSGMTDQMLGELMAVVGIANETNRLANGFRVPVDERLAKDARGEG